MTIEPFFLIAYVEFQSEENWRKWIQNVSILFSAFQKKNIL